MRPHWRCAHARDHRLGAEEHRLQVDRDGEVEVGLGERRRRCAPGRCRHCSPARRPAPARARPRPSSAPPRRPGTHRRAPRPPCRPWPRIAVGHRLRLGRFLAVIHRNRRARFGQRNGNRPCRCPREPPVTKATRFAQIGHSPLPNIDHAAYHVTATPTVSREARMARLGFGAFLAPHHPIGENPMLQFRRDIELRAAPRRARLRRVLVRRAPLVGLGDDRLARDVPGRGRPSAPSASSSAPA